MIFGRTLFSFLVAVTPAGAVAAKSAAVENAACEAVAAALPPLGTRLPPKRIVDVLAELPGSALKLEPKGLDGLVLESTYGGSLSCQRNSLFELSQGARKPVAIPSRFQGGEGALCGSDEVQLVGINQTPALMEASFDGGGGFALDIASRTGAAWSAPCELSIHTAPLYGTSEQFCADDKCQALGHIAVQVADAWQNGNAPEAKLAVTEFPASDDSEWLTMNKLADARRLVQDDLPTFGQQKNFGKIHSFVEWDAQLLPVNLDGELLLGKFGLAGFGNKYGWDKLFAAYRLSGRELIPVAGFYLSPTAQALTAYKVSRSPRY